jgi:1-acyl-sn-glycerol-3-phosphate acyltransferase
MGEQGRRRVGLRALGFWYALAVVLLNPLAALTARRDWRGTEHVPAAGGVILAANHISHADPIVVAEYVVHGTGRIARFMAKSTLFHGTGPVGGLVARVMRGAAQIPVHRQTADASLALRDAVAALHAGECIVIYPEGTVSRDPDKWPMVAKTGVARLALLSGAPVVPLGQWGAQDVLDTYRRRGVRAFPRKRVVLQAGPAVDLSTWRGRELSADVLREATAAVMADITVLVADLRGQPAPDEAFVWTGSHRRTSRVHDARRSA